MTTKNKKSRGIAWGSSNTKSNFIVPLRMFLLILFFEKKFTLHNVVIFVNYILQKYNFIFSFMFRFAINLQCGTDEGADIMYHFNPRIADNVLVCNNRCADSWGDEVRLEGLPIGSGDQFTLCIVAAKDGYQPIINGNPLPIFPHRLDMSAACTICIDGDVRIMDLTVDCPPVSSISDNMYEILEYFFYWKLIMEVWGYFAQSTYRT